MSPIVTAIIVGGGVGGALTILFIACVQLLSSKGNKE